MKVVIERHRWDRGQGRHRSIANPEGTEEIKIRDPRAFDPNNQCCVFGFGFNAAGNRQGADNFALACHNLVIGSKAIEINDDPLITDDVRENLLREEFKKYGHEVEFVD